MAKSGVKRKNYIQKIEGKYEKYLEKQRKPMKNYKAEKKSKIVTSLSYCECFMIATVVPCYEVVLIFHLKV